MGFEISKSASKNVTTGFAVWNITSSPKFFIGDSTSSMDWNHTSTGKLTVKGDVLSSRFSTTNSYALWGGAEGFIIENGQAKSYYVLSNLKYNSELGYSTLEFTRRVSETITDQVSIGAHGIYSNGLVVTKCFGLTDSPASTHRNIGDYFLASDGKLWVRVNGGWWGYARTHTLSD